MSNAYSKVYIRNVEVSKTSFSHFQSGWVLHPIFSSSGDYPPLMRSWMKTISIKEGYKRSRLPEFTKEEIEMIKGKYKIRLPKTTHTL